MEREAWRKTPEEKKLQEKQRARYIKRQRWGGEGRDGERNVKESQRETDVRGYGEPERDTETGHARARTPVTPRRHPYIENVCATCSRTEPYSGTQECWNPTDPPCILRLFPMAGAVHGAWGQNEKFWGHILCVMTETFSIGTTAATGHTCVLSTRNTARGLRNCLLDLLT